MNDSEIFGGQFAGERDRARLSRQIERIRAWALAREWFTLRQARESLEQLYAPTLFPEPSISTQLRHLEKAKAGKLRCRKEKRHRGGGVWEYRLHAAPEIRTELATLASDEPRPKIRWPATMEQLEAAGYGYTGRGKQCCPSCGASFLWFLNPRGKWIPLFALSDFRLMPHAAVCKNRATRQPRASPASARTSEQASLFPLETRAP